MNKKKNEKLLVSLSKYYILLLIGIIITLFVSYTIITYLLTNSLKYQKLTIIKAVTNSRLDYEEIDSDEISQLGAHISIIDNDGNVLDEIGSSNLIRIKKYSKGDLLEEIVSNKYDKDYVTLVNNIDYKGEKCYAVITIPNNKVGLFINFCNIPLELSKPIIFVYATVIILALSCVIICIILCVFRTSKKIKKPIDNINLALSKIIEGNYTEKISEYDVYEFGTICDTINYLTEKLKLTQDENKKLQESKNKMLLDLSHDIRTPITSIKGFSQALYDGMVMDDEIKRRYYKTIYLKSERVSELVDDLFEFVRMDKVQYVIKLTNVDICEYIRQIVLSYYDEIQNKGFLLEVNIPEECIMLKIDTKLFKRVIVNLIENALKYNKEGTRIRIEIRDINKFVVIEIADNGQGVPESIRDNLFEAFVRADASRKTSGGYGLGLSIAKRIVESHGGEIMLLNPRNHDNTIFYIRMRKEI